MCEMGKLLSWILLVVSALKYRILLSTFTNSHCLIGSSSDFRVF